MKIKNKERLDDIVIGFITFLFVTISLISQSEAIKLINSLVFLASAIYYVVKALKIKKGGDLVTYKYYIGSSILFGLVPVIIML